MLGVKIRRVVYTHVYVLCSPLSFSHQDYHKGDKDPQVHAEVKSCLKVVLDNIAHFQAAEAEEIAAGKTVTWTQWFTGTREGDVHRKVPIGQQRYSWTESTGVRKFVVRVYVLV